MFTGIRWRLVSYYLAVIAVVVLVMGAFFVWFLRYLYMESMRSSLLGQSRVAAALVGEMIEHGAPDEEMDALCKRLGWELGVRLTLVDLDGTVRGDSDEDPAKMDNHLDRPEVREALAGGKGVASRYSTTLGEEMLYTAVPVFAGGNGPDPGGPAAGVVRLALSLSRVENAVFRIQLFILAVLIFSTLAALAVGAALSLKITRPLRQITGAARAIAAGDFEPSLEVGGRDEMAVLAGTIREMGRSLRHKVQQALLEKNKLDAVLHSMDSAIVLVDRNLAVELVNPAAERVFNISRAEAIGVPVQAALRYYSLHDNLKAVLREGRPRSFELNLYYPCSVVLQASLVPVAGARGDVMGVLSLFYDITSLLSLEEMRSDFAANVSHELRTPLTAIKGYAETILHEEMTRKELHDFLQVIEREADRMSRLVDALLDLSRIEEKKGLFRKQAVDLAALVRVSLGDVTEMRLQKNISVSTSLPGGPVYIQGNPDWMRQAVFNILENSIKYGFTGGAVRVCLARDSGQAILEIEDNGPGIPAADLPRVFERFYRVDKARTRKNGGTGLGLAIVKHILEAHGAAYALESEEGKGTLFRITLPAAVYPDTAENEP